MCLLLQLSDLHLFSAPEQRLMGQDTRRTLDAVLACAQQRHWPPAALLLTGDLIHDERPATYRELAQRLRALGLPYYCLPGNHDRVDLLATLLDPQPVGVARAVALGAWELFLLDSTVLGEDGGALHPAMLDSLERALAVHADRPALIALHHQPVAVGSAWIDTMQVANADELFSIIDRHPRVRAVVWGHVHQQFDGQRGTVALLGAPSTCVQFAPQHAEFMLDVAPPGYRWLRLAADGTLTTGVERIGDYPEPLQLGCAGY